MSDPEIDASHDILLNLFQRLEQLEAKFDHPALIELLGPKAIKPDADQTSEIGSLRANAERMNLLLMRVVGASQDTPEHALMSLEGIVDDIRETFPEWYPD